MKTQIALAPHKHIRFASSLIGIAGYVRHFITCEPTSLEALWAKIQLNSNNDKTFVINFTHFIYALDILACLQEITLDESGNIFRNN